jgi:hypothetical protein
VCSFLEVAANVGFLGKSSSEIQRLFAFKVYPRSGLDETLFYLSLSMFGIIIV